MENRFPADAPTDDIITAIRQDGYAILERVIDEAQVAQLKGELQPYLTESEVGTEDFWGHHTKRFGALIGKSEIARHMLLAPQVLAVADAVLLEHCARYWVNYTGVMHLGPGEKAQVLHRDTNLWPITNPAPPLTVATMWAVSDFTKDNGGTRLVPGSHLWDDARTPEPDEIISAEMPSGSVLIYTGNVIHGGGSNRANAPRYGVALHYVLGWLRQEENQMLTMTREEARAMPEEVQRLMGYSLGASALGFADHRDPFEILNGQEGDTPATISPQELIDAEAKVKRLTVVGSAEGGRTRIEAEPT
ncbi:MAG: phytanoyl-CoA dioxygenase family protein [Pseudomonadota bacterium]